MPRASSKLLAAATAAMRVAIAPYSNFHVGAAIATASGKIYSGHNIESSSYSLTICAERVALFNALSDGERDFAMVAVVASSGDFCPPCGACRQVLMDFAPNAVVVLSNAQGDQKEFQLSSLLPESFSEKALKAKPGTARRNNISQDGSSRDRSSRDRSRKPSRPKKA
jgi:cytidine deaminase